MSEGIRRYARVKGRVQGVGFRYFTQDTAERLGLSGYVKNRPDGDVELEVEGPAEKVAELIEAVRRGPRMGVVTGVSVGEKPVDGKGGVFKVTF